MSLVELEALQTLLQQGVMTPQQAAAAIGVVIERERKRKPPAYDEDDDDDDVPLAGMHMDTAPASSAAAAAHPRTVWRPIGVSPPGMLVPPIRNDPMIPPGLDAPMTPPGMVHPVTPPGMYRPFSPEYSPVSPVARDRPMSPYWHPPVAAAAHPVRDYPAAAAVVRPPAKRPKPAAVKAGVVSWIHVDVRFPGRAAALDLLIPVHYASSAEAYLDQGEGFQDAHDTVREWEDAHPGLKCEDWRIDSVFPEDLGTTYRPYVRGASGEKQDLLPDGTTVKNPPRVAKVEKKAKKAADGPRVSLFKVSANRGSTNVKLVLPVFYTSLAQYSADVRHDIPARTARVWEARHPGWRTTGAFEFEEPGTADSIAFVFEWVQSGDGDYDRGKTFRLPDGTSTA